MFIVNATDWKGWIGWIGWKGWKGFPEKNTPARFAFSTETNNLFVKLTTAIYVISILHV
jgi:hypothetical protein